MKTIKIFLASSDELEVDRYKFGDFVRKLNDIYKKRGIEIELVKWEDLDASYQGRRTQDMYNEIISKCDMFTAVFHRVAGKFTIEEFDVARDCFDKNSSPKVYTYVKDLSGEDIETTELAAFKKRLYDELGHYWCRYNNSDTMQLHFVMQLHLLESDNPIELKVKNSKVLLDNSQVADLDNVPFAARNDKYVQLRDDIAEANKNISQLTMALEQVENESIRSVLNTTNAKQSKLQEEFDQYQANLLNVARRVSSLSLERISARRAEAIRLFNEGDASGVNDILSTEALTHDKEDSFREYDELSAADNETQEKIIAVERYLENAQRRASQIRENKAQVHQRIVMNYNDWLFKIDAIWIDSSSSIEEQVKESTNAFNQALECARKLQYDITKTEDFTDLLFRFAEFAYKYGYYETAKELYLEHIEIYKELCGDTNDIMYEDYIDIQSTISSQQQSLSEFEDCKTKHVVYSREFAILAKSYNNIGLVYHNQGDYSQALGCYLKGLAISKKVFGKEHHNVVNGYNNIGAVYNSQGDSTQALKYYLMALELQEKLLGKVHPDVAITYINIGAVYNSQGDNNQALKYYFKALSIQKQVLNAEHPLIGKCYNNIGYAYNSQGDYAVALEYWLKTLIIRIKALGKEHPDTAASYSNIGLAYFMQNNHSLALGYLFNALQVKEKVFGVEHPNIFTAYHDIGVVYQSQRNYADAVKYFLKSLRALEKSLCQDHYKIVAIYNEIGSAYNSLANYTKALEYYLKGLAICKKNFGQEHINTLNYYNNIRNIYYQKGDASFNLGRHAEAIESYEKMIEINENIFGDNYADLATSYNLIANVYNQTGQKQELLLYTRKELAARLNNSDTESPELVACYTIIGSLSADVDEPLECIQKALAIREKMLGVEHTPANNMIIEIGRVEYSIATYFYEKEMYADALPHLFALVEIQETTLGLEHEDVIMCYDKIAKAYVSLGDYLAALKYFKKCAALVEVVFGLDDVNCAAVNAAIGYLSTDTSEQLECHQKALGIRQRVLGEDDTTTAQSYFDVGSTYIDLKDSIKALEYLCKSLEIRIKLLGEHNEEVAATFNNIGYLYNEMGEYQKAMGYHHQALEIRMALFGQDDVQAANSYHHIGKTHNYLGEYSVAIEWLNKALLIRERELGADHESSIATLEQIEIVKFQLTN